MKRIHMMITALLVFCLLNLTVYAGDVPEGLLVYDQAEVFFGEVVGDNQAAGEPTVELKAVKTIKGDIALGDVKSYREPSAVGFKAIKTGCIYLVAYFDEVNPTYIFETTTTNTKDLKLIGADGNMWERFEKYLNDGEFEKAETERRDRINARNALADETTLAEYMQEERENTERVYFIKGEERIEVDKNDFFNIAEELILTKAAEIKPADGEGFYIELENRDSEYSFAYISQHGEADLLSPMMSRLPVCDYTMAMSSSAELNKLTAKNKGYYVVVIIGAVVMAALLVPVLVKKRKKGL